MSRKQFKCCWTSEETTQNRKHIHNQFILVFRIPSFFANAAILFWRSKMFASFPWSVDWEAWKYLPGMQISQNKFYRLQVNLGPGCACTSCACTRKLKVPPAVQARVPQFSSGQSSNLCMEQKDRMFWTAKFEIFETRADELWQR